MKHLNQRRLIGIALGILLLAGILSAVFMWNKQAQDTMEHPTMAQLTMSELMAKYDRGRFQTLEPYLEKAIEVSGTIYEVNDRKGTKTVILKDDAFESMVICEFQTKQILPLEGLNKGDKIRLKGIYKGSLMDVVLLNCVLLDENLEQ